MSTKDPLASIDESSGFEAARIEYVLCDLDGVVWLAHRPIAGAANAIARIRATGREVVFVTNNSMFTIGDQERALGSIGIAAVGRVVSSAMAAASLVAPPDRVLLAGGPGVSEAVTATGCDVVDIDDVRLGLAVDAVIVGLHTGVDHERLMVAAEAVGRGATFIATNLDVTYPTPDGPVPGAGALVEIVAASSGRTPTVAGKPGTTMAAVVRRRCGPSFSGETALMVGDRASTDGEFATALGCPFALVRSGVTPPGARSDATVPVALDVADLAAVADRLGC